MMKNDIERILYSEEDLAQCVQRLGAEISKDYEGKEIFAVAILKGAVVFFYGSHPRYQCTGAA